MNNIFFWVSNEVVYIPIDTENAVAAINYIHLN